MLPPRVASSQVRTAQFLNALEAQLPGGWAGFAAYGQNMGTLGVDPSSPLWIAVFVEGFVAPDGTLARAVYAYLTDQNNGGRVMTKAAASTQMAVLFDAAGRVGN